LSGTGTREGKPNPRTFSEAERKTPFLDRLKKIREKSLEPESTSAEREKGQLERWECALKELP